MIIWRGWGAIPIVIAGLCVALGVGMSAPMPQLRGVFIALLMIAGGIATWFIGLHLNQTKPAEEFTAWHAKRRTEIAALVQAGHYSNVPDPQRPGQLADPWAVGEYVLNQESTRVRALMHNQHSLFFMPMQYMGFVLAGIGVFAMVTSAISA